MKDHSEESVRSLLNKKTAYSLLEIREALLNSGARLQEMLHERVTWFVDGTMARLAQHNVRIAFVGQVKAGKSSILNAFMKRPDLLPTDINPSTAVITKVHFGSSNHPVNTALFHFFTEEEWEELFGKPKTRDPNAVSLLSLPTSRRSLEKLRQRARERLGPDYEKLLGKHHLFNAITPQLIGSYVSAGDFSKGGLQGRLFSDVTRMAEVFLDDNPILYPSVLIDTPGVNDLFFIREEITRANLADADVYVLILTAQQPLSRGDVSLLRLLRGLRRDKIIAVVNRVDMLNDIGTEAASLKETVKAALKHELPYANIPVIMTSALWANAALKESPFALEGLITRQFIDYASQCGVGSLVSSSRGLDPDLVVSRYAKALHSCSGLTELADCINRLIATSIVEDQLLPVSSTLAAISHNSAITVRYGLQALVPAAKNGSGEDVRPKFSKEATTENKERLETFVGQLEVLLKQMQKEWKGFANTEIANVERYMLYAVEKFADAQAFLVFGDDKHRILYQDWSENTLLFRTELADLISKNYNEICRMLFDKQHEGEAAIRRATDKIIPQADSVLQFGMRPSKSSPVYLMPLSKATVFEMDDFWQHEIAKSNNSYERKSKELKSVILAELYPIIKEMTEAAARGLELTIDEIVRHLSIFVVSSLFAIVQQLEQLKDLHKSDADAEDQTDLVQKFMDDAKKAIELFECEYKKIAGLKKEMFAI